MTNFFSSDSIVPVNYKRKSMHFCRRFASPKKAHSAISALALKSHPRPAKLRILWNYYTRKESIQHFRGNMFLENIHKIQITSAVQQGRAVRNKGRQRSIRIEPCLRTPKFGLVKKLSRFCAEIVVARVGLSCWAKQACRTLTHRFAPFIAKGTIAGVNGISESSSFSAIAQMPWADFKFIMWVHSFVKIAPANFKFSNHATLRGIIRAI